MKVICFGDSNTWGYDPRSYFGGRYSAENRWVDILASKTGWTVKNEGENGREIPRKHAVCFENSDCLIILLGTNDLLQGASAEMVAERMEAFLQRIKGQCHKILLIAPPILQPGEWVTDRALMAESALLAEKYRGLSRKYDILFLDSGAWELPIAYDGVHFTEQAHRLFADKVAEYLEII